MRRRVLTLIGLLLLLPACNLASSPPTPTSPPSATPAPLDLMATFTPAGDPNITPVVSDCPDTPPNWIPYTVERGDSVSLLAQQTDSTVDEIMAGNCMDNADQLILDSQIFLPRVPVVEPAGNEEEPDAVG